MSSIVYRIYKITIKYLIHEGNLSSNNENYIDFVTVLEDINSDDSDHPTMEDAIKKIESIKTQKRYKVNHEPYKPEFTILPVIV